MATLSSQIQGLIDYANETTGAGDTLLGDAVRTLVEGYGGGGDDPDPAPDGVVWYKTLVGDGVAYINTGMEPNRAHTYRLDVRRRTQESKFFGANVGWDSGLYIDKYNDKRLYYFIFRNGASGYSNPDSFPIYYGNRIVITLAPSGAFFENLSMRNSLEVLTPFGTTKDITRPIYLFAVNNNGTAATSNAQADFYRYTVTDAADLKVMDMRPCTYHGEPGMWDVVTSTFFGNANSKGAFSVSND